MAPKKPLARNLGEFVGHIWKAIRSDPGRRVVRRKVEEEERGNVVLRRTTIEEVELRHEATEARRREGKEPHARD
jgi:hypothetical protein